MTVRVVQGKPPYELPEQAKKLFHEKLDELIAMYESRSGSFQTTAAFVQTQGPSCQVRLFIDDWI